MVSLLGGAFCRKDMMALAIIALAGLSCESASAQRLEIDPDAFTVQERPRPEYAPVPIRIGSFVASASFNLSAQYDSNIFAAANNIQSDAVFVAQPRLTLQSNWSKNSLTFDLGAVAKQTLDNPTENNISYRASSSGRIDLGTRTNLTASLGYAKAFVQRGTLQDARNVGRPIGLNQISAAAVVSTSLANTQFGARVAVADFSYLSDNGFSQTEALERNFRSLDVRGTAAYAISSGIAMAATVVYNRSIYPDSSINRDSEGYRLLGGIAFGASRLVRGQANIGYQRQSYENPIFPKVSGLAFDASLTWTPFRTLTLAANIDRTIQRSAIANVAGIVDTVYSVEVDYEFRRNVILTSAIVYEMADYNDSPLRFTNLEGRVAAQWLISRRATANFAFNHSLTRSTDRPADRFSRAQASVGLKLSL